MAELTEVYLRVSNKTFQVKKRLLCEYSDYFSAMFSGNFVENEQREVYIQMLDGDVMTKILDYMLTGRLNIQQCDLQQMQLLSEAATFLQIPKLVTLIEEHLDGILTDDNWIEVFRIAKMGTYSKLENAAVSTGLLSFNSFSFDKFDSKEELIWYISNPYLKVNHEFDLFKCAYTWLTSKQCQIEHSDMILLLLSCLDISRLTLDNLKVLREFCDANINHSKSIGVVDLLIKSVDIYGSAKPLFIQKFFFSYLGQPYMEEIYDETLSIVTEFKKRQEIFTPIIPMWLKDKTKIDSKINEIKFLEDIMTHSTNHYSLYKFTQDHGFEKLYDLDSGGFWGWSIVAWGLTKFVLVGGATTMGSGVFVRNIKVTDIARRVTTSHDAVLPCIRHASVVIIDDTLYILGGVGSYRIVRDSVIKYDLVTQEFSTIAELPEPVQNPAVCVHEGYIYCAIRSNIYKLIDTGVADSEGYTLDIVPVIETGGNINFMTSHKEYIYCTQSFNDCLKRFKPTVGNIMEHVDVFSNIPACIINFDDRLLAFTKSCQVPLMRYVDEYIFESKEKNLDVRVQSFTKILWAETRNYVKINEAAGTLKLVTVPTSKPVISKVAFKYIKKYSQDIEDYVGNK